MFSEDPIDVGLVAAAPGARSLNQATMSASSRWVIFCLTGRLAETGMAPSLVAAAATIHPPRHYIDTVYENLQVAATLMMALTLMVTDDGRNLARSVFQRGGREGPGPQR